MHMTSHFDPFRVNVCFQAYNYVELFAGQGNVFSSVRAATYTGTACDIEFGDHFGFSSDHNPFNFMGAAGFAFLVYSLFRELQARLTFFVQQAFAHLGLRAIVETRTSSD